MWTVVGWTDAHQYMRNSGTDSALRNEYLNTNQFLSNPNLGTRNKFLLLSSFFHYSKPQQRKQLSQFKEKLETSCPDKGPIDIIYLSSASVYGLSDDPLTRFTEATPTAPLDRNGLEKVELENWLMSLSKQHGDIRLIIIRCAGFFGKRKFFQNSRNFVDILLDKKIQRTDEKLQVSDDGQQVRDFLYVFDLLKILGLIMDKPSSFPSLGKATVLNIATSQKYCIRDVISLSAIQPKDVSYAPITKKNIHNALNTDLFQSYFSNYSLTTIEDYFFERT